MPALKGAVGGTATSDGDGEASGAIDDAGPGSTFIGAAPTLPAAAIRTTRVMGGQDDDLGLFMQLAVVA